MIMAEEVRLKRKKAIMLAALLAGAAIAVLAYAVDPIGAKWMPKCAFHAFTGLQCPACGFTRALHALLHGHLLEALRYNYFFIISIPVAAAVAFTSWSECKAAIWLRPIAQGRFVILGYVALFFAWWIIRNILGI